MTSRQLHFPGTTMLMDKAKARGHQPGREVTTKSLPSPRNYTHWQLLEEERNPFFKSMTLGMATSPPGLILRRGWKQKSNSTF